MELGDASLRVQRASIGFTQASGLEMGVNAMSMFAGTTSNDLEESRVLQLLNMITPEELIDNDEYEGMSLRRFPLLRVSADLFEQKYVKTSKRNAQNMARSSS